MPLPSFVSLTLQVDSHIARVALNRPDKANAMSLVMWAELEQCFKWLDAEPSVRVIVLTGEGANFCSGLDISVFADLVDATIKEPSRQAEQLRLKLLAMQANIGAIEQCRKPVLAAIQGACVGGGVDLSVCCDMRYCTEDAYFSIKEIDLGMTADVGSLQRLPHLISQGMLRELAYTGRKVLPAEALSLGLVNAVYSDKQQMQAEVDSIAVLIAQKSPLAIRGTKEMLLYARDHSVTDSLNYIATWNAGMLSQADVMASIQSAASKTPVEYDD